MTEVVVVEEGADTVVIIQDGPQGPKGDKGDQGFQGVPGPAGPAGVEPGTVAWTVCDIAPVGWLMLDGTVLLSGQLFYPDLWAVIPDDMKSGSDILLPDSRGRAMGGAGAGPGLTPRTARTASGSETVTLTAAQSGTQAHGHGGAGSHTHSLSAHTHTASTTQFDGNHTHQMSGHVHDYSHAHSLGGHTHGGHTGTEDTGHFHSGPGGGEFVYAGVAPGTPANIPQTGAGFSFTLYSNWADRLHGHPFGTGGPSGGSDTVLASTGGPNVGGTGYMDGNNVHSHTLTTAGPSADVTSAAGTDPAGAPDVNASAAHDNMPPTLWLNAIIKY